MCGKVAAIKIKAERKFEKNDTETLFGSRSSNFRSAC